MKKYELRKTIREIISKLKEDVTGKCNKKCKCALVSSETGQELWSFDLPCTGTYRNCACKGMPLDCSGDSGKKIKVTPTIKRTLEKVAKGREIPAESHVILKGGDKIKEDVTGKVSCRGECHLTVDDVMVGSVGCVANKNGETNTYTNTVPKCVCDGFGQLTDCGGGKTVKIPLAIMDQDFEMGE